MGIKMPKATSSLWNSKRIIGLCVITGLFISAIEIRDIRYHRQAERERRIQAQIDVFDQTKSWRGFEDICYSGYCGPWLEEFYMKHYEDSFGESGHGGRIFLPIGWTNCHLKCSDSQRKELQSYVDSLDRSLPYFTVVQIARGLGHHELNITIPDDLDLLLFSAGGRTNCGKCRNVDIPLLKTVLEPYEGHKNILASFIGTIVNHPVRGELEKKYRDSMLFLGGHDRWREIMGRSFFSLAPRGFGVTSFRLFESIQIGSIPVYVYSEYAMLPYSERISWENLAVLVNESEISNGRLLKKMLDADVDKMLEYGKQVRHMFTYNYTSSYIDEMVQLL